MENGKSPRVDGIPIEFYNEVLETIILDLQKTFNETLFTNKKTPKTWNQAIITPIPKKGNIKLLKYWRPISLLCVDYKILTKILSNRLKYISYLNNIGITKLFNSKQNNIPQFILNKGYDNIHKTEK